MTTTKPPVLTDEEITALTIRAIDDGWTFRQVVLATEQAVLERAGADAVRDAALVRLMPEVLASLKYHGQDVSLVTDIESALKATPAAVATPTNQQISDYLHGLDAVKRQLIEREAGQPSGNAGEEDTARLDWLAAEGCAAESLTLGNGTKYALYWPATDDRQIDWHPTWRAAIDAAIASSKGAKP